MATIYQQWLDLHSPYLQGDHLDVDVVYSVLCLVIFGTHLNVLKDKYSKIKPFACRKSWTAEDHYVVNSEYCLFK